MKSLLNLLVVIVIGFATKTIAAPIVGFEYANSVCQKSLRNVGNATYTTPTVIYHDQDYLLMSLSSKTSSQVFLISQSTGDVVLKKIEGKVIDFTSDKDSIYTLTQNHIFQFEKATLLLRNDVPSIEDPNSYGRYSQATGISYFNDKLYISHGDLGLVVRDAKTLKQLAYTSLNLTSSNGHRAQVSDVDVKDNQILLGVDNITGSPDGSRGLEGYYLIAANDQLSPSLYSSIDSRREALDNPYVYLDRGSFFAVNWFYLFKYALEDMGGRSPIRPTHRYWNFQSNLNLIGRPSVGEDFIYSCVKNKKNEGSFLAIPRPLAVQ